LAAELKTDVRLKSGDQEFGPGQFTISVEPRDEGGMRLVVFDGRTSRLIEPELMRSSIEFPYLTLSAAPSDTASFALTIAWGKDLGQVRFWVVPEEGK
jgi:hypothetical protein